MALKASLRSVLVQLRIGGGGDVTVTWELADGETAVGTIRCANREELAQVLEDLGVEPF